MILVTLFALFLQSSNASPAGRLEAVLAGSWAGTLEYRDYRSDRRVTLPTRLVVTPAGEGALSFAYTYDDGPGKVVTSIERITIDREKSTYRVQNGDGSYDATFAANGLAAFGPASPEIVLAGKGDENGVAVDLRITITASPSSFTMLRESKKPGDDWLFRNQYKLTR